MARNIIKNLNRPMPDLLNYLYEKLLSVVWKPYIKEVGSGFHLSSGAKIRGGKCIYIGKNFQTGPNVWLEAVISHGGKNYSPKIEIGSFVRFSDNVHIACTNKVLIENGVLIGSNVHITDHSHGIYSGENHDDPELAPVLRTLMNDKQVIIGANVWIGDGVVVLPGVSIGNGSIIGANSVVSKSIRSNVIAVGNPAKAIKAFDSQDKKWKKII